MGTAQIIIVVLMVLFVVWLVKNVFKYLVSKVLKNVDKKIVDSYKEKVSSDELTPEQAIREMVRNYKYSDLYVLIEIGKMKQPELSRSDVIIIIREEIKKIEIEQKNKKN